MTTTPSEPVGDDDIETVGGGSGMGGDGTKDGVEGGGLDTQDESDADASDATTS